MREVVIGIDLGTTNSELAVVRDGQVEIIEIEAGNRLLPSVVGLSDDGDLLVGTAARNQYALYPERTIRSIKRRMGEDSSVTLGSQSYRPQEISAMILRRLKEIGEGHLGVALQKAVITVPAYFSDAQRQATREAGEIAELDVVRIINEPTAAALAYETDHPQGKRLLVYDLGGGTFDVSVVSVEKDVVEVLASHGNNHLGGDDFDQKIVDHVLAHVSEHSGADLTSSPRAVARVVRAAEAAKIQLSSQPYARIEEEYLLEHKGGPLNLSLELARDDYEDMIRPYVDETLVAVHNAMESADLGVRDLDEVLLVGGATRTPVISRRLEDELGLLPRSELDPDLCVATGAAIQAGIIAGESVQTILVDVTPYTFGISGISQLHGQPYPHCFFPLIRRNTPIPVTRSEVFHTSYDGQQVVEIPVYQGEDPDALNNTEIGSFRVEGLRDEPAGNPVTATFALDIDGILEVTAREKETGLSKTITIDNAVSRFEGEHMETARERVSALFDSEPAASPGSKTELRREVVQANALVEKAEGLLQQASEDDRDDMVDLIEAIRDAINAGQEESLERHMGDLSDLIYYLES